MEELYLWDWLDDVQTLDGANQPFDEIAAGLVKIGDVLYAR
jgi:hypothetical protein